MSLFKQHRQAATQVVDNDRLETILASARGMQGGEIVEQYVADVRSGKYQMPICTDDPKKAAFSVAAGLRAKNVVPFGLGMAPPPFQCAMIFDPPDGPGAGAEAYVVEGVFAGATDEAAQSLLLGTVTLLGDRIWRRLRALVLVPIQVERDAAGNMAGEVSMHFGWLEGDEVKTHRINTPMSFRGGKLEVLPAIEVENPETGPTRLIRAAFEMNRLAGPIHAKHKLVA